MIGTMHPMNIAFAMQQSGSTGDPAPRPPPPYCSGTMGSMRGGRPLPQWADLACALIGQGRAEDPELWFKGKTGGQTLSLIYGPPGVCAANISVVGYKGKIVSGGNLSVHSRSGMGNAISALIPIPLRFRPTIEG